MEKSVEVCLGGQGAFDGSKGHYLVPKAASGMLYFEIGNVQYPFVVVNGRRPGQHRAV